MSSTPHQKKPAKKMKGDKKKPKSAKKKKKTSRGNNVPTPVVTDWPDINPPAFTPSPSPSVSPQKPAEVATTAPSPKKRFTAEEIDDIVRTNSDPVNGISLCIPRVFNNITAYRIKGVLIGLRWGYVERVDLIHKGSYKRAFIHFRPNSWNRGEDANNVLAALKQNKSIRVVYDDPWYWNITVSKCKRPTEAPKKRPRPSVFIQ